ncbi:hypothetical protein QVA66_09405 [Staphylococcus chromogenes]|nr:hypothetical protein [Staphylococcus chromogenes]
MKARALEICIFITLVLIWVATPFMGDRVPAWTQWGYWIILVSSVILGFVVAFKKRNLLLGLASLATLFAWPIILAVALAMGGIA